MYMCQNFGVHDIQGQIPKGIHQASYLLHSDFLTAFPKLVLIKGPLENDVTRERGRVGNTQN